jgi:hypothetical protein
MLPIYQRLVDHIGTIWFSTGYGVTVRVFVMLGIYFVSVKYVFVKCKACVRLCETFENLKVQIKRVIFVITEKPRVVFVKCIG